MKVNCIPPA